MAKLNKINFGHEFIGGVIIKKIAIGKKNLYKK